MVHTICRLPPTNATRPRLRKRRKENSSPMENSSNATPRSAKLMITCF